MMATNPYTIHPYTRSLEEDDANDKLVSPDDASVLDEEYVDSEAKNAKRMMIMIHEVVRYGYVLWNCTCYPISVR